VEIESERPDEIRELMNRTRILETVYSVAWSLDTGDWDLLRSIMPEDGVVDFSSYAGRENLRERDPWIANLAKVFPQLAATQHTMTNPIIKLAGDTATCTVHMHAKHVRATARGEGRYDLGGFYTFDLVRRGDVWLIVRLVHVVSWEEGNARIMQEAAVDADA
jgi:lauroyl/myristoyl acyltransferase